MAALPSNTMSDCMEVGGGVLGSEYNGEFRGTAVSVKRRSSVVLDDHCKKKAVPTEPGFHQFGENMVKATVFLQSECIKLLLLRGATTKVFDKHVTFRRR